jgi:DNA-binding winged helix-turn-helix (wHTH) protein
VSDVAHGDASARGATSPVSVIYTFGEFELDPVSYSIRSRDRRVEVEPKIVEFVAYLIRERSRVVRKQELREALWPGIAVSESSLSRCAWAARKVLGDHAQRSRIIKTVYGRGYQFVAPVEERRSAAEESGAPAAGVEPLRFVGRHSQMAALRAAAVDAFAGHGGLAFLVGEAGIGKTRMAEELATWARERGALVRFGRCREEAGAPAFFPWLEILRAEVREREHGEIESLLGSGAPEIAQLVPELGELLPALPPPPPLDPSQARFRLFESLLGFWRTAARKRPLLLVLDDLHRGDEPSLKLLHFVGPELGELPVLVVGCFREGPSTQNPVARVRSQHCCASLEPFGSLCQSSRASRWPNASGR